MAKKKNRKQRKGTPRSAHVSKRQRSATADPFALTGQQRNRAVAGQVLASALPVIADPRVAGEQLDFLMRYERWLNSTSPTTKDARKPSFAPGIYKMFWNRWPQAFEFYRHSAFAYISSALGAVPWGPVVVSLLHRLRQHDEAGYQNLVQALQGAGNRFREQRISALRLLDNVPRQHGDHEALRLSLLAYAALYEVDLPLWFLGVVGKALQTGTLDPTYLGGPNTATTQGSLIESVKTALDGSPLSEALDIPFDRNLRNAVGHNDYQIIGSDDAGLRVRSLQSSHEWSEDDVWRRLTATHDMIEGVVLAAQLAISQQTTAAPHLADCGVISMTHHISGTLPLIILTQLWCFRDLDPKGLWIAKTAVTLKNVGGVGYTSFTPNATCQGPAFSQATLDSYQHHRWARVVRVPVAPALGAGFPTFRTVENDACDVVGPAEEYLAPLGGDSGSTRP